MTLRWVPSWNGLNEPEAVSYIAAVEAADGQELEFGVARAINDFVTGCKQDKIWDAIKACCILAGARTLDGALVPLVGAAPTNNNFVSGDYDRETGLKGDGSTKYLDSNRNNNADPQNNNHICLSVSTASINNYIGMRDTTGNGESVIIGGASTIFRNRSSAFATIAASDAVGFVGMARSSSGSFISRVSGSNASASITSNPTSADNVFVFARNNLQSSLIDGYSAVRLAFYSIGESLDLEKLDNRVTRLMNLISYTQAAGLPDLATMDLDAAAYIGGGYRAGGTLS